MRESGLVLLSLLGAGLSWAIHDEPAPSLKTAVTPVVRVVPGRGLGVGMKPALGSALLVSGQKVNLEALAQGHTTVVLMSSTTCPISKKLRPTLLALEKKWQAKGVKFLEVYPYDTESTSDIKALGFTGTQVRDKGSLQGALQAKTTTEAFVLDSTGTMVYRGAVNDQYAITGTLPSASQNYLEDAIQATISGGLPAVDATDAPGCALNDVEVPKPSSVTYYNQISRLMQKSCVTCHRPGGIAPFKLDTYADVSARKKMLGYVTSNKLMPPWFADDEPSPHGKWANETALTKDELSLFQQWITDGAPQGNPKDAPKPLSFPKDWRIGTPTHVFQIPQPIDVKADGVMEYQIVEVDPHLNEDMYVTAYQIRPTAASVVHHVLIFAESKEWDKLPERERERKRFTEGDGEGVRGFFAGYVPGNDGVIYPAGFAKKLPKGMKLRFQIHYTPNGTASKDQPRIGLVMSKTPPVHEVKTTAIAQLNLNIPPNTEKYVAKGRLRVPMDAHILSFMPHMHLRGAAFKYELLPPGGGEPQPLLNIPRYDFNWQLAYTLKEPLAVKQGTWLSATGVYNNSKSNPFIKDPERTIHFGDQTTDEMFLGYLEYYQD